MANSGGYRRIISLYSNYRGLIFRPKDDTQPEDMTRWETSTGTLRARISALGQWFISKTSVPADAELGNSEFGIYGEDTVGSPKIKAKIKDSAGTATILTLAGASKGFVNHGSTAGTARPTGYASIEWYGSVQPSNAVAGDTWVDTS